MCDFNGRIRPRQTDCLRPPAEQLATLRTLVDQAEPLLRCRTRDALAEVRALGERLAAIKETLPPGSDIRSAVAWLNSEVGRAEAEAAR